MAKSVSGAKEKNRTSSGSVGGSKESKKGSAKEPAKPKENKGPQVTDEDKKGVNKVYDQKKPSGSTATGSSSESKPKPSTSSKSTSAASAKGNTGKTTPAADTVTARDQPTGSGSAQGPSTGTGTAQGPPAEPGSVQGSSTGSGGAQGLSTGTGTAQGPPAEPGSVQDSSTGSGGAQGLSTGTGTAQGPPAEPGSVQGSSTGSGSALAPSTGTGGTENLTSGTPGPTAGLSPTDAQIGLVPSPTGSVTAKLDATGRSPASSTPIPMIGDVAVYHSNQPSNNVRPRDVLAGDRTDDAMVAAMRALVVKNPDAIDNMITANNDGSYTVSMFDQAANPVDVNVTEEEWSKATVKVHDEAGIWGKVLQTAVLKQVPETYVREDYLNDSAETMKVLTGKDYSLFNINDTPLNWIENLRTDLDNGKMAVLSTAQDVREDLVDAGVKAFGRYALTGWNYSTDTHEYNFTYLDDAGDTQQLTQTQLFSGDFYASVADGSLKPKDIPGRALSEDRVSKEQLMAAHPWLSGKIVDWGFEQAGSPRHVEVSRVNEMIALNKTYLDSEVPFSGVSELYVGKSGGLIKDLRDRGLSYGQIPAFAADFASPNLGYFQTNLLEQFVNNAKNVSKEKVTDLWDQGVSPNVIATLTNTKDGGLLKELYDRKLGVEGISSAVRRAVTFDTQDARRGYFFLDRVGLESLEHFNGIAKHKPNEWAQGLLATNVPYMDTISGVLDSKVLGEIIDDRKVGSDRVGRVFEWAYQNVGSFPGSVIAELEKFNAKAKHMKKEDIWNHIDNNDFAPFG